MTMTIPRIDEDVVVRVEKNESGSSLLVQQPQKPQALTMTIIMLVLCHEVEDYEVKEELSHYGGYSSSVRDAIPYQIVWFF